MPDWVRALVAHLGYWVVPLGIGVESVGVPIPAETMYLAASALAANGILDIRLVILLGAMGACLGGQGGYALGARGGTALLNRLGPRFGLTRRRLRFVERFFERFGGRAVFLGRFQFVLRTYLSFVAGAINMPPWEFARYNVAGGVAWAICYGVLGYTLGAQWETLRRATLGLSIGAIVAIFALVAAGVGAWMWRRHRRRA